MAALAVSIVRWTERIPMSDGVELATEIAVPGPGRWPSLVARTPYGRNGVDPGPLLDAGYAVVVQDVRGTGDSGGSVIELWSRHSGRDGRETLRWLAEQPWSDGRVGTFGASALGIEQVLLAAELPPELVCQHIVMAPYDLMGSIFRGGVMRKRMVEDWIRRHGSDEMLRMLRDHSPGTDRERVSLPGPDFSALRYPTFHVGGWFDPFCQDTIDAFRGLNYRGAEGARGRQVLVLGPWVHGGYSNSVQGELRFPENSKYDIEGERIEWFDSWLKSREFRLAPVRYYVMGDVDRSSGKWNTWRSSGVWPVPSKRLDLYLRAGGGVSEEASTENDSCDDYVYDPADPVPTVGGATLAKLDPGPRDQRSVESRGDVLVYDLPVRDAAIEITGFVWVELWVCSESSTTDFTAKLTDVYPDGRSMLILDGITRVRGLGRSPSSVRIELGSTSLVFAEGHSMRLAISSSNYPRYERNSNIGPRDEGQGGYRPVRNTVFHDRKRSSRVVVPRIAEGAGR